MKTGIEEGGNRAAKFPPTLFTALKRGFLGFCPRCGHGRIFAKFLKSADRCAVCGLDLHHHRADDLPPYLAIFLVGHIVVAGFLMTERAVDWPLLAHLALWAPLTVLLSVLLLQPLKGGVIALQWFLGMHGFERRVDQGGN